MNKRRCILMALLSLIFLFSSFITNVSIINAYASSMDVEAIVDDSISVRFSFMFQNVTLYEEIKNNPNFNVTTIPKALKTSLEARGFLDVQTLYDTSQQLFDDSQHSVTVVFKISGSSIQSASADRLAMKRLYTLRMHWRKFSFNFTDTVKVNLEEVFSQPVFKWENKTSESRFSLNYLNTQSVGEFHQARFSISLPLGAKNIRFSEDGERIFYELPFSFEDNFINSPLLILAAILFIVFLANLYRAIIKIVKRV